MTRYEVDSPDIARTSVKIRVVVFDVDDFDKEAAKVAKRIFGDKANCRYGPLDKYIECVPLVVEPNGHVTMYEFSQDYVIERLVW